MKKYKVLLLGYRGLIGDSLLSRLGSNEHLSLTLVGRSEREISRKYCFKNKPTLVAQDITKEFSEAFIQHIEQADIIINCIGELRCKAEMYRVNFEAPARILDLFVEGSGPKLWVQLSSCGVFRFKFNSQISVTSERRGRNRYERSKICFDLLLKKVRNQNLSISFFYPSVVLTNADPRLYRFTGLLERSWFRILVKPDWVLNVVSLQVVSDALIDEIQEYCVGKRKNRISDSILNEPKTIRSFTCEEHWRNIGSLSQIAVRFLLISRLLPGRFKERLIFICSNMVFK